MLLNLELRFRRQPLKCTSSMMCLMRRHKEHSTLTSSMQYMLELRHPPFVRTGSPLRVSCSFFIERLISCSSPKSFALASHQSGLHCHPQYLRNSSSSILPNLHCPRLRKKSEICSSPTRA